MLLTVSQAPGEPCWPPDAAWSSLNVSVSGRLFKPTLAPSVCYKSEPNYNTEDCSSVISNWTAEAFHSSDPVSIHAPAWANNSCNPIYPNGTSTAGDPLAGNRGCTIGRYPYYVINATEASHVQAALKFVKKWNLRLNIKNTGHNSKKSTAFGSLSIWTHHMKSFKYDEGFRPTCGNSNFAYDTGLPAHSAVTVGAGMQDNEVFQEAAKLNLAVVGGTNRDVGLVGWATGGGHGWLTSQFGMGADNIIQSVIVTPAGETVIANDCQNSDIFWAIRGGGGGTFGIITEVTMKAYPMPQATTWVLSISDKNNSDASRWWDIMSQIHAELPRLKQGGMQGYYSIGGPPSFSTLSFYGYFFLYNQPNGTAETLAKPILSLLDAANDTVSYSSRVSWAPSWISVFNSLPSESDAGGGAGVAGGGTTTSRLLSAAALIEYPERLARTLELVGPKRDGPEAGVTNPVISGCMIASSKEVDNALNPAWRDTVVHFHVSEDWRDSLPYTQVQITLDDMTNTKGLALRMLEPNSGAYLNEADPFEPDWQRSFWGANYEKLIRIKKKYDPYSVQWCPRCVGSEDWVEHLDGRLCRIS